MNIVTKGVPSHVNQITADILKNLISFDLSLITHVQLLNTQIMNRYWIGRKTEKELNKLLVVLFSMLESLVVVAFTVYTYSGWCTIARRHTTSCLESEVIKLFQF